ncbi:MAG TPA: DUF3347 domain-containing protein [Gillisia sp.]|nr:DUF3347 domain-containing protein [Gillisia sp.]
MKTTFKNSLLLALVAGSFTMYSCRETNKDEPAEPMQHEMREGEEMDHDDATSMSEEKILNDEISAEFEDDRIASVYQHYIHIKNALVRTDATLAQDRAKAMVADLENSEANADVATAARSISTSNDVNQQREAFSNLTKAMETELEGAIASGEIYKQFCPMAFEGKGDSWYSNSTEIRNPYYGDKMLKCGRVEATIN